MLVFDFKMDMKLQVIFLVMDIIYKNMLLFIFVGGELRIYLVFGIIFNEVVEIFRGYQVGNVVGRFMVLKMRKIKKNR